MDKIYIGIDPGSKGFITVIGPEDDFVFYSIADHTIPEIAEFINSFSGKNVCCAMEEVHAIFGASAKSTFAFGEIFGLLKGFIIASNLPYILIQPKMWQKELWINADEVRVSGKINTKATSINAAQRLYPKIDLRRNGNCDKFDDNKADSLLIATYAKRKNI